MSDDYGFELYQHHLECPHAAWQGARFIMDGLETDSSALDAIYWPKGN